MTRPARATGEPALSWPGLPLGCALLVGPRCSSGLVAHRRGCWRAIPGFTGEGVSLRSAIAGAPAPVASDLRGVPGEAVDFAWRAAGHGSLLIAVWRVKTVAEAMGQLRRWRDAVGSRHPSGLAVGDGAFMLRAGSQKAPALVVLRVGSGLAELRFETSAAGAAKDSR